MPDVRNSPSVYSLNSWTKQPIQTPVMVMLRANIWLQVNYLLNKKKLMKPQAGGTRALSIGVRLALNWEIPMASNILSA